MNAMNRESSIFDVDNFCIFWSFKKCDFMNFFEMSSDSFKVLIFVIMVTDNPKLRILRQSTKEVWCDIEKVFLRSHIALVSTADKVASMEDNSLVSIREFEYRMDVDRDLCRYLIDITTDVRISQKEQMRSTKC